MVQYRNTAYAAILHMLSSLRMLYQEPTLFSSRLASGQELVKSEMTDMEKIAANMENSDDLTLDDIREVLRLMQQEGFFDLLEKSVTPPLQEGMQMLDLSHPYSATLCIFLVHVTCKTGMAST